MTAPRRIQLRRTKGWRLAAESAGAKIVARPHRWGNPHKVGPDCTPEQAVERYRDDLLAGRLKITVADVRGELAGRDLACWCHPGAACHGDVLLEVANQTTSVDDGQP